MEIENNITRFTDLEHNDSLSGFKGLAAQQHHNAYRVFYDFLSLVKPQRILEIGTALGGFTEFLKLCTDSLSLDTKILSYDIHEHPWYGEIRNKGIDIRVENIFNPEWTTVKNEVIEFVQQEGITIVLCDGGWKIGEYNIFSKLIKNGDYILVHDYCLDADSFEKEIKNKIWNWCEIMEKDIETAGKENHLIPFQQEIFEKVVWNCKIKTI